MEGGCVGWLVGWSCWLVGWLYCVGCGYYPRNRGMAGTAIGNRARDNDHGACGGAAGKGERREGVLLSGIGNGEGGA